MKLVWIMLASLLFFGCATSQQTEKTPQKADQTADKIGPLTAHPIEVVVIKGLSLPDAPGTITIGPVTITVTATNSQQGSTEQAATQTATAGDQTATPTQTTDAQGTVTLPLTP